MSRVVVIGAGLSGLAAAYRLREAGIGPGTWRIPGSGGALLEALPVDGRIQVAGDLFGAGSMESAVRWGELTARRPIARFAG